MIQYLFGDDTFTARKHIHEQAEQLKARVRFVDREDGEHASIEELFDSAKGSLLGATLVVIQDPSLYSEERREALLTYCTSAYSGNVIVWDRSVDKRLTFHKKMQQLVSSKEVAAPADEATMVTWAAAYAPNISLPSLRELVSRVGFDVWAVAHELDKLSVLASPVQVSDVKDLVAQRDTIYASAFPLLDAIVRKQKDRAVAILGELVDGGASERFVLAMLAYQFRLFLGIKIGQGNRDDVASMHKKTGFHPTAIRKAMAGASRLSLDAISDVLHRIAATEKSLITTKMDPRSIVTMLVIGLCR